jgi:hypothetical protein
MKTIFASFFLVHLHDCTSCFFLSYEPPCSKLQGIKRLLPVTARSVATRQSHCKRLLRFARNDPLYDDQTVTLQQETVTLQQAAGNYQVKPLHLSLTELIRNTLQIIGRIHKMNNIMGGVIPAILFVTINLLNLSMQHQLSLESF